MQQCKRNDITHCLGVQARLSNLTLSNGTQDRRERRFGSRKMHDHVISREAPPPAKFVQKQIQQLFGFFTIDHAQALESFWWIATPAIVSNLWLLRKERILLDTIRDQTESRNYIRKLAVRQYRAVVLSKYRGKKYRKFHSSLRRIEESTAWPSPRTHTTRSCVPVLPVLVGRLDKFRES